MLTELRLENFKCFKDEIAIPASGLNLLTGINSKGKSTTLQLLLLLHQSIAGTPILERIELNGSYVRLGSFRELQHRDRPAGDEVNLGFELAGGRHVTVTRLWLHQSDPKERWAGIKRIEVERFDEAGDLLDSKTRGAPDETALSLDFRPAHGTAVPADELVRVSCLERLGRVHYVSADRLGPQEFFPRTGSTPFLSVGVRGERCAEVLYRAQQEQARVDDGLVREEAETLTVVDQASAWLSYVFDGGAVRVRAPHDTILTLEMNADGLAHYYRPVNLGFGYSYVLPILVAGLVAKPGEILVIENPEAHLHPLAQSRIGEFLARVSAQGVQVFVESHSEHILNAFRLAVHEGRLPPEQLSVLYFRRDPLHPILRVTVEDDGRIPDWPEGFFDQRTHDFLRLFGV